MTEQPFPAARARRRITRKELQLFFGSPVAWLFLASFAALTLFIFFWVESWFARNIADIRPLFEWMPVLLIFLASALTMRTWSEEHRSGTLEHVLTQPVSLWRFVSAKFLACFALLTLALAATIPLPLTAHLLADVDWGPVGAGYLATCLLGATYISAGLLISARTDNPIVSLTGSIAICGLLYLVGSDFFTGFFDTGTAELLRKLGTGARFESISRGMLDSRDILYYLSLTAVFLTLNVYTLEKVRWAHSAATERHRYWRTGTALLVGNLILANIWLDRVQVPRIDLTEGRLYSISTPTRQVLNRLQEPLLIRGYFSNRTHPLLAPLVPELRDLIREYALATERPVKIEFIDPAENADMEREANERFGIHPTPFQVSDRHQATLVNSYFQVLVQYGNQHQVLGFTDLVELRSGVAGRSEAVLRNPEYDLTRAIREAAQSYRAGGNLFTELDRPVEFIGYISSEDRLPGPLLAYRDAIEPQLQELVGQSAGRFSFRFIEPEQNGGELALQIEEQWGFKPMVTALDDTREFYFYLTLADAHQVVQLSTQDFDPEAFRQSLETGLKRFVNDITRTVSLAVPPVNEHLAQQHLGPPTFINLERAIARDYSIRMERLSDGSVDPEADILAVVAPQRLDEASIYAIDQFLMRGGTLVLATSPFSAEISGGRIRMQEWDSGLQSWLAHHGIDIERSLVLDPGGAPFPTPLMRKSGEHEFHDVQVMNYPYLVDIRDDGLATDHPITRGLPQVSMAWSSPLRIERGANRRVTSLLRSSEDSWTSRSLEVMPVIDDNGMRTFPDATAPRVSSDVGVTIQGRFESFFADRDIPVSSSEAGSVPGYSHSATTRLDYSPESARIVLFASNDFMDDQILNAAMMASGTRFLGPLELLMSTIDWALSDDQLLQIRYSGHFNRTLPSMSSDLQRQIEYLNYALAIAWLLGLALFSRLLGAIRRRRYRRRLAL